MIIQDFVPELLGLGVGAVTTLTCFVAVKGVKEIFHLLKEIPELHINENLTKNVKESEDLVGCVWGVVEAEQLPIHSIQNPAVTGVIWKQTIKEHFVTKIMGAWMNEEKIIGESTRSVPFFLTDNGIKILISAPSKLDKVDLSFISETYEPTSNSFMTDVIGWMKGIRTTGVKHTEEMLIEGTRILAVGKLCCSKGKYFLEPHPPLPFLVTTMDKESILEDLASPLPIYKCITFFAISGMIYCLYRICRKLYEQWKKDRNRRTLLDLLRRTKKGNEEATDRDLPESLTCVICCGLRDVVLMPCKHICVCAECSLKLNPRKCPVCRAQIESIEPVFYS